MKYVAVGKSELSDKEDIIMEFDSCNLTNAKKYVENNFDCKLTWVVFKMPTDSHIPRAVIIEPKGI